MITAHTLSAQDTSDQPENEVEVRASYLALSGEANFTSPPVAGTTFSFDRDFDLPNSPGVELRYTYRSKNGRHKLLADYFRASFDATRTLSRTIVFQGQVFPVNLAVKGEYKLDDFRVMYAYRWGNRKIRIGPMADAGFVRSTVKLDALINNASVARTGRTTKFALTVGYDLDYNPTPKVNIFHTLGGIAAGGDRLFRTEAGVRYYPIRNFGVSGGYSFAYYKTTEDPDFVLVRPRGPFFGGIIRF